METKREVSKLDEKDVEFRCEDTGTLHVREWTVTGTITLEFESTFLARGERAAKDSWLREVQRNGTAVEVQVVARPKGE